MNEVGLNANWLHKDLTHKETQDFVEEVLNHMRERLVIYQGEYGDLYNLEATPAESTSYRLAKHDKERYPDIVTASENGKTPYYTNSSHLPVGYTDDIFSALDIEDRLQTLYTSGTVFHAFLGEKLPDWKAAANLVRKIAENYKLPYYTLSPTYSVCKDHGYIAGEHFTCPKCGQKAEVYSRITGYYRPVQNWNDGKLEEYKERRTYNISTSKFDPSKDGVHALKNKQVKPEVATAPTSRTKIDLNNVELVLFTTPTCPKCQIAKRNFDQHGISYTVIDATTRGDLVDRYQVSTAPTLVLLPKKAGQEGPIIIRSFNEILDLVK